MDYHKVGSPKDSYQCKSTHHVHTPYRGGSAVLLVIFKEVDWLITSKGAPNQDVIWVEHVFSSRPLVVKVVSNCILQNHEQ